MGSKTSRRSPPTAYANRRIDATWEVQGALVSDDLPRQTKQQLQNFHEHTPGKSLPVNNLKPPTRTHSPSKSLGLRKSRSNDHLAHANRIITAEELLSNQAKRRGRGHNRSPSAASSISNISTVQKSSSSTSVNQLNKKKVPNTHKFVLINSNHITNCREIGKGNFGTVYHALYKGTRDVALKSLHPDAGGNVYSGSEDNIDELLYEAHIMTRLKHANLLRIIGVTFFGPEQKLSLVTDFMKNGSLLDYLREHKQAFLQADLKKTNVKLNRFAEQIFEGMLYLEQRGIIHRDLAARNCLIGQDETLKVGDFGLTKLTECGLYKGTSRSVCAPRWTSPEAVFFSKYSSRSDVWSYGITLWEIYSLGQRPFGQISNFAFQSLLRTSSENIVRHLPPPRPLGSEATYTHLIVPCLTHNVTMRPRFRDLQERLATLFHPQK